jgi:TPR repeat protein
VQKNYWIHKQLESYLEIAEQGHVNAQTAIGAIFSDTSLSVHDDAKAAYWYLKAAENGFIDAQQVLGLAYETGTIGLQKDYQKAANWYLKAAQQGDPYSSLQLGYLNLKGLGVEQDFVKAEYWFDLPYGNTPEPYSRGRMAFRIANEYENLPDRNNEKIIFWLKEAEENLKKDLKNSFEEFYDFEQYGESCSGLLLARSQSRLSIAFELLKDKTSKSFWEKKAFKHWLVLAENGLAEAQHELGWFYLNGWGGVEQDWKISSMWLEKAAHQGNPKAQIDLGMSYEYGRGVPKNLNLAMLWYRKGYEGGYDSGGNFVEELEKKLKKGILGKLFT